MAKVIRQDEIQGAIIHEYDGIEEADNALPNWWLVTFYAAIAFSAVYWIGYHVLKVAPLPMVAYEEAASAQSTGPVTEEELMQLTEDSSAVEKGKALFAQHCAVCHEADGRGKIGPNLTDAHWLHGGGATDIHRVISQGIAAKGMPAWGAALGQLPVKRLSAFVLSIRNSNIAGKSAEGKIWQAEAAEQPTPGGETSGGADGQADGGSAAKMAEPSGSDPDATAQPKAAD